MHDRCRHVFRDADYEWTGSGANPPSDTVKAAFLRLLQAMPVGFAAELHEAVKARRFHTWFVAPMIGGGGVLTLYGVREHQYGEAMLTVGEADDAELYADGYRWLASLYDDQTPDASEITLRWLDEWEGP